MRKYYIDNIKLTCILLLFFYHTGMIWNNFGAGFYVHGEPNAIVSAVLLFFFPILMPMLFALAGVTLRFSLKKRTKPQVLKERTVRLLLPTIMGVIFIVPVMTFFAEKFNNGFEGNYIEQYAVYFSKAADENGYTGGVGLGNLWFLLYLFVITIMALIFISLVHFVSKKLKVDFEVGKLPFVVILVMFVFPWVLTPVLEIMGGKSVMKFFALFILGYYLLSNDKVLEKCEKYRYPTLCIFLILEAVMGILCLKTNFTSGFFFNGLVSLAGWVGILAILGLAKHGFDFTNKGLAYLCRQSFSIYIFHQAILVTIGYFVLVYLKGFLMPLQFVLIMILSFILTVIFCEIMRRIPYLRALFGIKSEKSVL